MESRQAVAVIFDMVIFDGMVLIVVMTVSDGERILDLDFTKLKFCMLVGTVENRQADLSMNLALTGAREKVIDYSAPYIGSYLRLCLCV